MLLGLDAAGKTTILYKMKLGEVGTVVPTIGYNVEALRYKNLNFTIWDVSGGGRSPKLWKYYYE
jgi:ADP-ribosylation factor protein 1